MFYVKLTADKKVERYPYTLTDLRRETPGTSFPEQIDDATAASFGVVPVEPSTPPPENFKTNLKRTAILKGDNWVEEWLEAPATSQQIKERTAIAANDARLKRNQLLTECDWTQLPDAPTLDSNSWAAYRQGLRNVPEQQGFPWNIVWPELP